MVLEATLVLLIILPLRKAAGIGLFKTEIENKPPVILLELSYLQIESLIKRKKALSTPSQGLNTTYIQMVHL